MAAKFQDYYQELGVARGATSDEIQKAYRALARKFHPDVNKEPTAEARFKAISEAYEVLKDDQKRKLYDQLGENWKHGQEFAGAGGRPGWSQRAQGTGSGSGAGFSGTNAADFSDFFESMFGGSMGEGGAGFSSAGGGRGSRGGGTGRTRARPRARDGQSREVSLSISLRELYRGGTHRITLSGVGLGGSDAQTYDVRIPAGATVGSTIRLPGQGEPGIGGGEPGDLLLTLSVQPDPDFRIDESGGHDLHTIVLITPWEAALGAKVDAKTLDGELTLTIPAGSQSGQKLRIRGKGLPKKGGERGDLIAELRIVVPRTLTADERVAFEALATASNFRPRSA